MDFSLSMMWGLETSDQLSGDILDMPEFNPTFALKQPSKRHSLASLKRQKAIRATGRLDQQTHATHLGTEMDAERKRFSNRRSCHACGSLVESSSAMTLAQKETTAPASCLSLKDQQNETVSVHRNAKITAIGSVQLPNEMCNTFLAGAVALGLRRSRVRSTSQCPVQPGAQRANNTTAKFKQCLNEATKVPHAPRRPQSENYRKRPQFRGGVPVLVVSAN